MIIQTEQLSLLMDFIYREPETTKSLLEKIRPGQNLEISFFEYSKEYSCHVRINRSSLEGLMYNSCDSYLDKERLIMHLKFK